MKGKLFTNESFSSRGIFAKIRRALPLMEKVYSEKLVRHLSSCPPVSTQVNEFIYTTPYFFCLQKETQIIF